MQMTHDGIFASKDLFVTFAFKDMTHMMLELAQCIFVHDTYDA